jgi:HEAT repeat protein
VPLKLKLTAKSFIDTVVWRAGDGLGGVTVLAFVTLGGLGARQLSWVTLPMIAIWVAVAALAFRRYVGTLEESVTQHRLDLERVGTPVLDRATTDILAKRLDGVDPKEILYALDLMSASPHQAAHPGVRGLLDHPAEEVRRRALEILGDAGDRTVLERVEALLADPSVEVRTEALLYLARHADVDPLMRVQDLGDFTDASIRGTVIAVLTRLGEGQHESARLMFEAMIAEEGPEGLSMRREAARLAERLPVVFEEPLRVLLQDEDTEVARSAIRAVRRHGGGPFADLLLARMGDGMLRDEARLALSDIGTEVLETVTRVLDDPHVSPEIRQAVPELLERIGGDEAAGILSGRLMEGDAELRLRVLRVLAKMREQRPTLEIDGWALEAVLGAEILGHYRSYQILGALERSALKEEPTTRGLRIAMLEELERIFFLLGLLYPGTDFRATWEALRSGKPVLRDQALDLLESRLKPEMRALLVPLIDPEVPGEQRMELAEKLAGTPVTSPTEAVRALAATGDPWLKSCAAYAIGAHGLLELKDLLDEWEKDADPLLRETVRQAQEQLRA